MEPTIFEVTDENGNSQKIEGYGIQITLAPATYVERTENFAAILFEPEETLVSLNIEKCPAVMGKKDGAILFPLNDTPIREDWEVIKLTIIGTEKPAVFPIPQNGNSITICKIP